MKETICTIAGLIGGFIAAIFGGWDSALVTLVIFMCIDFFTGVVTAAMKKSKHTESGGLSSKAGWFGLAKKVCTLLLIAVAVRMDIMLGTTYIRDAVCISFCLNELLSIVENTSLLSSLAQEESRSISENVTWGQRKRFADGKVSLPYKSFLGYRKGADGLPEIVPEEAEIVRYIYRRFIAGLTPYKIAAELTEQGIPTPAGKKKWASRTIKSILTNEKYKGDALLQKKFTVDFLTKKQKINEGEIPQYYVENSHPAIITPEEFDMVQEEFLRRENAGKQYSSTSIFASKMICGDCGSYFGAKVWHSNSKYRRVIYQCNSKFKGEHFCTTPHLYEPEIQQKFLNAFSRYFEQKDVVIKNCLFVLNQLKLQDEHNSELQAEFDEINKQLKEYIESGGTDSNYSELNARYEEIAEKIDAEEQLVAERKGRIARMQEILRVLRNSDSILETFDENIWTALVETLTVFHDGSMVFLFKDGTEIKI